MQKKRNQNHNQEEEKMYSKVETDEPMNGRYVKDNMSKYLKTRKSYWMMVTWSTILVIWSLYLMFYKQGNSVESTNNVSNKGYDNGVYTVSTTNIKFREESAASMKEEPAYDEDVSPADPELAQDENSGETPSKIDFVRELEKDMDLTRDMEPADMFEDFEEWNNAPWVRVNTPSYSKGFEPPMLRTYTRMYTDHPIKSYVPTLKSNIQLSLGSFSHVFRRFGMPVKFSFESLRKSGFGTQFHSLEELREMFPYEGEVGKVYSQYKPNRSYKGEGEVDLGPGLADIARDAELSKSPNLRSFPRNMKVRPDNIARLQVDTPRLIDSRYYQKPTLWMGTSSSGTAFHSDCCDNLVMMISGTKRFTLAPPTDFYELTPNCVGKANGLCYATPSEPKPDVSYSWNRIIVDVGPGEVLYMPSNWFHHVENVGPTVMVNIWTRKKETHGIVSCNQ